MDDNNNREKITKFITELNTYKDASIPVILDPVNPKANETNSPAGQQGTEAVKTTRKKGKRPADLLPIEGHRQVRQSASTMAFNGSTAKDTEIGSVARYGRLSYSFNGTATPGRDVTQKKLVNYLIEDIKNPRTAAGRRGAVKASDFLTLCGISPSKQRTMAATLASDCERVLSARVSGKEKRNGNTASFVGINMFQSLAYKRGMICYNFSEDYAVYCLDRSKMYLPEAAYQINPGKSPNGFSLAYYIYYVKHMNVGHTNEDVYNVSKLLENCPYITKAKETKKNRQSTIKEIIRPFYNALTSCSEMFGYMIIRPDGELAEDEELDTADKFVAFVMDYDTFIQCVIQICFKVDPYPKKRETVKKAIAEHMTDEELDRKAKEFNEVKKRAKSLEAKERRAKKKADNKPDD